MNFDRYIKVIAESLEGERKNYFVRLPKTATLEQLFAVRFWCKGCGHVEEGDDDLAEFTAYLKTEYEAKFFKAVADAGGKAEEQK